MSDGGSDRPICQHCGRYEENHPVDLDDVRCESFRKRFDLHPLVIGQQAEFGLWGWFCIRCSAAYQEDGEEGVGMEVSPGRAVA